LHGESITTRRIWHTQHDIQVSNVYFQVSHLSNDRLIYLVVRPKTTTIPSWQLKRKYHSFLMKSSFLTVYYLDRIGTLEGVSKKWRTVQMTSYCNNYALSKTINFQSYSKSVTFIASNETSRFCAVDWLLSATRCLIWKDKRDSAHWLTFWAVIIIGGAGLLLGFMQVLLQAIQLANP
jgi:hypothetical protein